MIQLKKTAKSMNDNEAIFESVTGINQSKRE